MQFIYKSLNKNIAELHRPSAAFGEEVRAKSGRATRNLLLHPLPRPLLPPRLPIERQAVGQLREGLVEEDADHRREEEDNGGRRTPAPLHQTVVS